MPTAAAKRAATVRSALPDRAHPQVPAFVHDLGIEAVQQRIGYRVFSWESNEAERRKRFPHRLGLAARSRRRSLIGHGASAAHSIGDRSD